MNEKEIIELLDQIAHLIYVVKTLVGAPVPKPTIQNTEKVQVTLPIGAVDGSYTDMMAISQLYPGLEEVDMVAIVVSITPITSFNRRTGGTGTIRRVFIKDETDQIALLLWNDQCGIPDSIGLKPNDRVHIHAQKITKSPKGETEITMGHSGFIRKV